MVIAYVFLGLFVLASGVHLYHSWKDDAKKRAITKPMLLIFLLLFYIFAARQEPYQLSWVLVVAIATSWLGDVLLIPKGNVWFTCGGIAFLISHITFIAVYVPHIDFTAVKWYIVIPVAIVYLAIALKIILSVKKNTPKIMVVPMYLYLIANSTMNIFALMQLMSNMNFASIIAYIGAILFFTSDCTLFLVRYHDNKDIIFKRHFTVMLTYLLGEALITVGILLLK